MSRVKEAGFDLTPIQLAAMQALKVNPGIEQAKIATLIAYDRATIGGVVERLEKKGYVTRAVSKLIGGLARLASVLKVVRQLNVLH